MLFDIRTVKEHDFNPGSIRVEDKPLGKPDIGLSEETRPKSSWGEPTPSYEESRGNGIGHFGERRDPSFTPDTEKKDLFTNRSVFEGYRKEKPESEELKTDPLFEEESQEDYEKRVQDVIEERFNRPDYNSWHKHDRHTAYRHKIPY